MPIFNFSEVKEFICLLGAKICGHYYLVTLFYALIHYQLINLMQFNSASLEICSTQQNMFAVNVLAEHNKTVVKVCSIQGKKTPWPSFGVLFILVQVVHAG